MNILLQIAFKCSNSFTGIRMNDKYLDTEPNWEPGFWDDMSKTLMKQYPYLTYEDLKLEIARQDALEERLWKKLNIDTEHLLRVLSETCKKTIRVTEITAIYVGDRDKMAQRKKLILKHHKGTSDFSFEEGQLYSLSLSTDKHGRIFIAATGHPSARQTFRSAHEFLKKWSDISSCDW